MTGGAALLGVSLFLAFQGAGGGGGGGGGRTLPVWPSPADYAGPQLAAAVVEAVCTWQKRQEDEAHHARSARTSSREPARPSTSSVDGRALLLRSTSKSDSSDREDRDRECNCLKGLEGATAGFAAISAILALSLAQAALANANDNGKSDAIHPTNTGASVEDERYRPLYQLLPLLRLIYEAEAQRDGYQSGACIAFRLCTLNRAAVDAAETVQGAQARTWNARMAESIEEAKAETVAGAARTRTSAARAGATTRTAKAGDRHSAVAAVRLASLPLSYLVPLAHPGTEFGTLCRAAVRSWTAEDCGRPPPGCYQEEEHFWEDDTVKQGY